MIQWSCWRQWGCMRGGVDVGGGRGGGLGAHGLDEGGGGEVDGVAEDAAAVCGNEVEGGGVDAAVGQTAALEFSQDEGFDVFGCEGSQEGGVGDAAAEVFVDGQGECGEQFGLGEEDDGVVAGGVFEQEAEFAQVGRGHEVGVVDGEGNGFCLGGGGRGLAQ